MDVLKPLGLAPEDVKLPLSPRSNDAYARINEEFDLLYSQLQEVNEQAGQNHAEVRTVVHALAIHVIACPELLNQTQENASTCLIYTLHIMLLVVRSCSPKNPGTCMKIRCTEIPYLQSNSYPAVLLCVLHACLYLAVQ